ncbi:MAG: tetratricopeptide repeat protein [Leptospiraceae bacterium]|nr:tetratricopeptide repeat protein [Leptospiraceae bacterium]
MKNKYIRFNRLILVILIMLLNYNTPSADPYDDFENSEEEITTITDPDREKLISDAKIKLEISKLTQTALAHIKAKEWKNAEAVTKQILDLSEVSVDYFYLKGNLHYCYGEYQTAISHLNTALKFNPSHDPSYFLMGMIYVKRNEWDKSISYFEKATQHGSYNPYYRMNLAIAYFQADNYDKAIFEAKKTLELKENYTFAKILLVKSLIKTSKKDAWAYLQNLMEKKPDAPNVYSLYIQLLFEYKNNYSEVIKELGKKSSLSVNEKRYLAISYYRIHDLPKAIVLLRQIMNAERDLEEDQTLYLKILLQQNKDSEAEKYLVSLIRINPIKKKQYNDLYQNLIEKRDMATGLYQPIIVR